MMITQHELDYIRSKAVESWRDRVLELEKENARLRRETQSYKNLIARYEAVKPTNECIGACPYLSQAYANEEALRAVVEAVDELMAWDNNALEDVDPVTGKPFLNPACEDYKVAVRKVGNADTSSNRA
jgi:hypothetical protein